MGHETPKTIDQMAFRNKRAAQQALSANDALFPTNHSFSKIQLSPVLRRLRSGSHYLSSAAALVLDDRDTADIYVYSGF